MVAEPIRAAGGVVLRRRRDGVDELLIVHRVRYDDWVLPKGKLEQGETFAAAELREVAEETAVRGRLERYVGVASYESGGQPKIVRYWRMTVVSEDDFHANEEVRERAWLPVADALQRISYPLERAVVQAALEPVGWAHEFPLDSLPPSRVGFVREWASWIFFGGRSISRLLREYELAGHLGAGDYDAGWACLHAARRSMLRALDDEERLTRGQTLLLEADKLSGWRRDAMKIALAACAKDPPSAPSHVQLIAATEHRDAAADNTYHKIGLMADQLGLLFWIAIVPAVLVFLAVLLGRAIAPGHASDNPWSFQIVVAVIVLGVLGASFSAVQSIIGTKGDAIPERVGNKYVTLIRAWGGGTICALAGHALIASEVINVTIGRKGLAGALAIAFLFGYAGERPISRVAETLGGTSDDSGRKPAS